MVVVCTLSDYNFYPGYMQGVYTLYTTAYIFWGSGVYLSIHTKTN